MRQGSHQRAPAQPTVMQVALQLCDAFGDIVLVVPGADQVVPSGCALCGQVPDSCSAAWSKLDPCSASVVRAQGADRALCNVSDADGCDKTRQTQAGSQQETRQ